MGMGRELALRLRREGCALALCDVNMEALDAVKSECEALAPPIPEGAKHQPIVTAHRVDVRAVRLSFAAFA